MTGLRFEQTTYQGNKTGWWVYQGDVYLGFIKHDWTFYVPAEDLTAEQMQLIADFIKEQTT